MALVLPNSVFIHVPKTGGSWVRAAIANTGMRCEESGPFDVHDHYGVFDLPAHLVRDRFTFGFVRHPVDWIKSRWAWGMLSGFAEKIQREPAAMGHWMAACWDEDLSQFVSKYLDLCPGVATSTMLRMLGWRYTPLGWEPTGCAVDFIGKYADLVADTMTALRNAREFGISYGDPVLRETAPQRVGAQGPFAAECESLDPDLIPRILAAEAPLCEIFGYGEPVASPV